MENINQLPGLQVASVIGSTFRNFLGPSKSVKLFVEQDELQSVSIASTSELLQLLDTQHPIGEMIASAVQTHDSVYGCYSTTMVVLLGHWCQEFRNLMTKGYPISLVLDVGDELLESCIKAVKKSSISLNQMRTHREVDGTGNSCLHKIQSTSSYSNTEATEEAFNTSQTTTMREMGWMATCGPDGIEGKEMGRGTKKTVQDHGKESYQCNTVEMQNERKTGYSSDERLGHALPREMESRKWSTYQEIMEDEDVSWFFTDDQNEAQTDLLPELMVTDAHRTTPCDYQEDFTRQTKLEVINIDTTNKHDMCGYNLGTPSDGSLKLVDAVTSSSFGSQIVNNLTGKHSLKTLPEHGRNSTNQLNHKAKVIDSQEVSKDPDSDDEFAGCFDDLPNLSQDGNLSVIPQSGTKLDQSVGGAFSMKDNDCPALLDQNDTNNSAMNEVIPKGRQNLTDGIDALIEKKIKKSSKLSLLKGMSQSRYFRTMKNTENEGFKIKNELIAETQRSGDAKFSPKIDEFSEVNLELIINKKKQQNREMTMDRALMQSRHFQKEQDQGIKMQILDQVQSAIMSTSKGIDETNTSNGGKDNGRDQTSYNDLKSISKNTSLNDGPESDGESIVELVDLLGPALSYGSEQAMKIAMEMFKRRNRRNLNLNVNTKWLHICTLLGPSSSESRVEAGLILPFTSCQVPLVTLLSESQPNLLLVSGDVEPKYHHLGYKESVRPDVIITNTSTARNSQKEWKQNVLDLLKWLNISIMVVKGTVDSSLCADCLAENVLVVQQAKYSALKTLSAGSEANILTYILDAEELDVGSVSSLNALEGGWNKGQGSTCLSNQNHLLRIETDSSIQTAVLCAPSQNLLDGLEYQLMSCIHRLTQAFADDKVLPGAGYTEVVAINNLNETSVLELTDLVDRQDVARALQSGWKSYLLQLVYNCKEITDWSQGMDHVTRAMDMNASPCGCDIHSVIDCINAKVAAWKTAWKLLGVILRTDMHIATGLDDNVL